MLVQKKKMHNHSIRLLLLLDVLQRKKCITQMLLVAHVVIRTNIDLDVKNHWKCASWKNHHRSNIASFAVYQLIFFSFLIVPGLIECTKKPNLVILPVSQVQRKPVGKSLMLTCRANVKDMNLVTDLKWRDNKGNTIFSKQ